MNLAVMLRRTVETFADRPALVLPQGTLTWGDLYSRSCQLAGALAGLGVAPGDRVATLGDNSGELLEQVAACALGNFPRAALYPYHGPETNAYLLDMIGAKVLIVDGAYLEEIRPKLEQRPGVHVIVVGPASGSAISYQELLASSDPKDPHVDIHDDDVHIIRFSSGTTGRPKGIWHSNARWRSQSIEFSAVLPTMDERDVYLASGALTHIGVGNLWAIIQSGASVVPMGKFDAANALDIIERHGITYTAMAPIMVKSMVEHPNVGKRRLDSMRCLWYAGSPIADSTRQAAIKYFGPALYQIYGMSESSPMSVLRPHEHLELSGSNRHRSAGRPTYNMHLTIRDDEGNELPRGQIGEIAAVSPGTMSGIWGAPEDTAKRKLADGSVLTRDVGYFDPQGWLYLVDRKDDMIISGGYNIWPSEIELALRDHASVLDTCVVGIPDPQWGETPLAVVVLDPQQPVPTKEELIAFVRAELGGVKKPTRIEFVDQLPRTGSGKVLRREVRANYTDGSARIQGS